MGEGGCGWVWVGVWVCGGDVCVWVRGCVPRNPQEGTATLQTSMTILFSSAPNQRIKSYFRCKQIDTSTSNFKSTHRGEILPATVSPSIRMLRHFKGNIISIPILRRSPGTRKVNRISTQVPFKITACQISKRGSPRVFVTNTTKSRQPPMTKQITGPVAAIQ